MLHFGFYFVRFGFENQLCNLNLQGQMRKMGKDLFAFRGSPCPKIGATVAQLEIDIGLFQTTARINSHLVEILPVDLPW